MKNTKFFHFENIMIQQYFQNEINCNTFVFTLKMIVISETMDAGRKPVSVHVMTNAALDPAKSPSITI